MARTLNLGFIGGGINSAVGATHFIAARMDGRFDVHAGCFSRHREINVQTADQWRIAENRRYDDLAELLHREKSRIDAIVVLTPTPSHAEVVIQAIEHGIPVICEKALANSSDEVLLIKQAQAKRRGFLAVTYNYSGYPMLRELKHRIQKGMLGKIEQVHIEMPQEGFARLNRLNEPMIPQPWRLLDSKVPTLSLDLGVHLHYIVDFLTGEKPIELVASQSSLGRFRQVVDNAVCIARYSGEIECVMWYGKAALGYRNGLRVRVFGDTGSAEWHQMDPEFIIGHDNKGHQLLIDRASVDVEVANQPRYNRFKSGHPAGFIEAFANHYWDIADSLCQYQESGKQKTCEYVFNVDHAYEGLVMLEALSQSSEERCWKTVNFEGTP